MHNNRLRHAKDKCTIVNSFIVIKMNAIIIIMMIKSCDEIIFLVRNINFFFLKTSD